MRLGIGSDPWRWRSALAVLLVMGCGGSEEPEEPSLESLADAIETADDTVASPGDVGDPDVEATDDTEAAPPPDMGGPQDEGPPVADSAPPPPAKVCEPGAATCTGDFLATFTCAPDGTRWVDAACPEGTFCQAGDPVECIAQVCAPDTAACDGDSLVTCLANGSDWALTTDCAAAGQGCEDGACVELCVDDEVCDGVDNNCNGKVDDKPNDCKDGAKCHEGTCYAAPAEGDCWVKAWEGHVYLGCHKPGTDWFAAKGICESWYGGHLVVFDSKKEEDALKKEVGGPAWIGFSDQAEEGTWTWLVGESEYTHWCPKQPDNWMNNEHCATMKTNVAGGKDCWNDAGCASKIGRFVCEAEPNP